MTQQQSIDQQTQLLQDIIRILDKIQGFSDDIDNITDKLKG